MIANIDHEIRIHPHEKTGDKVIISSICRHSWEKAAPLSLRKETTA